MTFYTLKGPFYTKVTYYTKPLAVRALMAYDYKSDPNREYR